jgi:hypothetical protein
VGKQSTLACHNVNPLVTSAILIKLAGITYDAKYGIPLCCFIFKMNSYEDIVI